MPTTTIEPVSSEKGCWRSKRQYRRGDLVSWKKTIYRALATSIGERPDQSNGKWSVTYNEEYPTSTFLDDAKGTWQPERGYVTGDVVSYNGSLWAAYRDGTGHEPDPDEDYWLEAFHSEGGDTPGGGGDTNANPGTLAQRTSTGALRAQTPLADATEAHSDDLINRGYATPYLHQVEANQQAITNLTGDLEGVNEHLTEVEEQVTTNTGNLNNIGERVTDLETADPRDFAGDIDVPGEARVHGTLRVRDLQCVDEQDLPVIAFLNGITVAGGVEIEGDTAVNSSSLTVYGETRLEGTLRVNQIDCVDTADPPRVQFVRDITVEGSGSFEGDVSARNLSVQDVDALTGVIGTFRFGEASGDTVEAVEIKTGDLTPTDGVQMQVNGALTVKANLGVDGDIMVAPGKRISTYNGGKPVTGSTASMALKSLLQALAEYGLIKDQTTFTP